MSASYIMPGVNTLVLCLLGVSMTAHAGTPQAKTNNASTAPSAGLLAATSEHPVHTAISAEQLDLRPPLAAEAFESASVSHFRPNMDSNGWTHGNSAALSAYEDDRRFSNAAAAAETSSEAKAFAQRFRREGLPIARLWENHSALVCLGLNQKGKPGIWLVQKTH